MRLAREYGVTREAAFLCDFDFGIPVRTLDQSQRNSTTALVRHIRQEIDDIACPTLIGLDGQTQTLVICH